jgi:hypothetical protein
MLARTLVPSAETAKQCWRNVAQMRLQKQSTRRANRAKLDAWYDSGPRGDRRQGRRSGGIGSRRFTCPRHAAGPADRDVRHPQLLSAFCAPLLRPLRHYMGRSIQHDRPGTHRGIRLGWRETPECALSITDKASAVPIPACRSDFTVKNDAGFREHLQTILSQLQNLALPLTCRSRHALHAVCHGLL